MKTTDLYTMTPGPGGPKLAYRTNVLERVQRTDGGIVTNHYTGLRVDAAPAGEAADPILGQLRKVAHGLVDEMDRATLGEFVGAAMGSGSAPATKAAGGPPVVSPQTLDGGRPRTEAQAIARRRTVDASKWKR